MIILLFIVCVLICILSLNTNSYGDEGGVILLIGFALLVLGAIFLCKIVVGERTIDAQILMYQEENAKIESQIEAVVTNYMQYEHDTFIECSSESAIVLADLYPELKADTLISKQIDIYIVNNEEIKKLKLSKLKMPMYKWWLYFGK